MLLNLFNITMVIDIKTTIAKTGLAAGQNKTRDPVVKFI